MKYGQGFKDREKDFVIKEVCDNEQKKIKSKIKSYGGEIGTNFHDDGLPLEKAVCNIFDNTHWFSMHKK